MAEHWCDIHKTKFFKTAKMSGYAHPVKDAEGITISWCNEDAQELKEKLDSGEIKSTKSVSPPLQSEEEPIKKTREQEIAGHVWVKELGEWLRIWEQWPPEKRPKSFNATKAGYFAMMWSVLDIKIEEK